MVYGIIYLRKWYDIRVNDWQHWSNSGQYDVWVGLYIVQDQYWSIWLKSWVSMVSKSVGMVHWLMGQVIHRE